MIQGNDYFKENLNAKNLVNINEEDKLTVWLFPRTGSKLFFNVMVNCGFKCYSYENTQRKLIREDLIHHHLFHIFPAMEEYKLIATARNPYSLMVSHYRMFQGSCEIEKLKSNFIDFLESVLYTNQWYIDYLYGLHYVEVSYKVRLEKLIEDYHKIPIITKSKHFQNQTLVKLINSKVNKSENKLSELDYRQFYNKNSADLVYYVFSKYFDIFEYDKNSWK